MNESALVKKLNKEEREKLREAVHDAWHISQNERSISREFVFKNYCNVISFFNAIAWITQKMNHHPDILVSFKKLTLSYTTHDVGGLSKLDFECIVQVDRL